MADRTRHLRPNPHTLGVEVLADGEKSETVRVRGPAAVVDAFKALSAAERGALIAKALA
jgi:hypothetical protein